MRTGKKAIYALLALNLMGLLACEKSEDFKLTDIEGIYEGTFSESNSLKSTALPGDEPYHGTAEVTMMENNQIQVHCFGVDIDTTFMLGYYEHHDSVLVCLTGEDFENHYGHRLGHGHMGSGMMGHNGNGETDWMHHLNDEHKEGDEHFGGFNMHEMTFTYSFRMMDGSTPYYLRFQGEKQ